MPGGRGLRGGIRVHVPRRPRVVPRIENQPRLGLRCRHVGRTDKDKSVILDEAEWTKNTARLRATTPSEATRLLAVERARRLRLANDTKEGQLVSAADVERDRAG